MIAPLELGPILRSLFYAFPALGEDKLISHLPIIQSILSMLQKAVAVQGDGLCFAQRLGARGLLRAVSFNLRALRDDMAAHEVLARREIEDAQDAIDRHRDDLYPGTDHLHPVGLAYDQLLVLLDVGRAHPDLRARHDFEAALIRLEISICDVREMNQWFAGVGAQVDKGPDREHWNRIGAAGFVFGEALIRDAQEQTARLALQTAPPAGEG